MIKKAKIKQLKIPSLTFVWIGSLVNVRICRLVKLYK